MTSARKAAAGILLKMEQDGAYSSLSLNGALKGHPELSAKDGALVTRLVYGVTERKLTLDYNISLYLRQPLKKLHPQVLCILRLGAYQILFADKIPVRAAVNESVQLAKESGVAFAAGLINAVLRKVASFGLCLPDPSDTYEYLSVKYSCPQALLRHFISHYGQENAQKHLAASNAARPLFIRCNTLRCTPSALAEALEKDGIKPISCQPEGCFLLEGAGDITALSAYKNGLFHVQDMSSQIAARLVSPFPGSTVADVCAAPGGKSFTMAEMMEDRGVLYAFDIYPHKTALIENGARRLGIGCIRPVCADARLVSRTVDSADAVLCDVPCSGLGVIGRKPEIRYKELSSFSSLPQTQYEILTAAAGIVRPGGVLVYSTCTLNPAENEEVCEWFLAEQKDFRLSDDSFYRSVAGEKYMNIFASASGGDGFFAARFERNSG